MLPNSSPMFKKVQRDFSNGNGGVKGTPFNSGLLFCFLSDNACVVALEPVGFVGVADTVDRKRSRVRKITN